MKASLFYCENNLGLKVMYAFLQSVVDSKGKNNRLDKRQRPTRCRHEAVSPQERLLEAEVGAGEICHVEVRNVM